MARSGGFWAGVVLTGAALGAVVATGYFVATYSPITHDEMCTVSSDGATYARTGEQTSNAALVAAGANKYDLGTNASTVAIATAIQESGLRNLDYGDRDSLGLFQQRPSQGWGTAEEVQDPYYATRKFYRQLMTIDGWEGMRVTEAAQAVQRSGFPEAYEDHVDEAAAWAAAFRGDAPFAAVNCDLEAVTEPSTAKAFATRVRRDWGEGTYEISVVGRNDRAVLLGVTATSGSQRDLDAFANWSVGVSWDQALASVTFGDAQWLREQGVGPVETPTDFAGVLVAVVESVRTD